MLITLNGFEINSATNNVWLDQQIDGLDLPALRTSSGNYSGRAGGYIGGQFFAPRDISLQGAVFSSDISSLEANRKAFQAALYMQYSSNTNQFTVTVGITTNAGNQYVIYCNLIDLTMPLTRDLFSSPFKLELLATDPTIYDNSSGGALTASLPRLVTGGFPTPVTFPWTSTGGGSPTTINNSGTTNVFPTITLSNIMNNPVLTNLTTGAVFSLSGLVTNTGDVVVIDMRPGARTVTLNGSSIFGDVGSLSAWWYLQPGNNSISLTTPNGSDTVTGVVSWRPGYPGI